MDLSGYFENTNGTGVLATADDDGAVDVALYARPHFIDESTIAFIMNERLSYQNLKLNRQAAYLFIEDSNGHKGKRLYLKKVKESDDAELIDSLRRKTLKHQGTDSKKHLVYFEIEKIRDLAGE